MVGQNLRIFQKIGDHPLNLKTCVCSGTTCNQAHHPARLAGSDQGRGLAPGGGHGSSAGVHTGTVQQLRHQHQINRQRLAPGTTGRIIVEVGGLRLVVSWPAVQPFTLAPFNSPSTSAKSTGSSSRPARLRLAGRDFTRWHGWQHRPRSRLDGDLAAFSRRAPAPGDQPGTAQVGRSRP